MWAHEKDINRRDSKHFLSEQVSQSARKCQNVWLQSKHIIKYLYRRESTRFPRKN